MNGVPVVTGGMTATSAPTNTSTNKTQKKSVQKQLQLIARNHRC
jgi:hypothetical protein